MAAAASQVYQRKRGRDEYWNGGLASPHTKRINSGLTLAQDSDLMALLDEIDNLDANNSNPDETDAAKELEISDNGVIESLEDEIGLKVQTENNIESTDEKVSADQMGSFKQGKLTEDGSNSEAASVCDIGDWTYYDDVRAELGYFVEHISPDELGIIIDNYIDGDSMANIMYSDAVDGYGETPEELYGSLWDHDIWQVNEHPVVQNDFESLQKEEVGSVVSEGEFPDVWNDIRSVQRLSDDEKGL